MFGISNTLLYYPAVSVVSEWFDRKRGFALGIIASGSSLGGIFWPIVVDKLDKDFGMKYALMGVGLIPLLPLVVSSFLVKERESRNKLTWRRIIDGQLFSSSGQEVLLREKTKIRKAISQPTFIVLSVALFFIYAGMLLPFNYIPLFAEFNGKEDMANILLAICYSGSIVGRIGSGWLADRLGSFNVLCVTAILTAALTLCWITMRSLAGMIAFAFLYGLFSGGLVPLGSTCVAGITATSDMDRIGFRVGFMMMICSVGAVGSGPLAGFLLDAYGKNEVRGWLAVFLFSGLLTLVGAMMILAMLLVRLVQGSGKKIVF